MGRDIVPQNATTELAPSPAQLKAVAALAGGATIAASAVAAGVDRSTVYRWMAADAIFAAELNRVRRDQADAIRGELRGLAADAIKTLRHLVTSSYVPPAVRLRAAVAALEAAGGRSPEPIGPTEPEAVLAQWEGEERAQAERLQDLITSLG